MTFHSENAYRQFEQSVKSGFRFARTPEQNAFLDEVARSSKNRVHALEQGLLLHRAQLGHGWRGEEIAPGEFEDFRCAHDVDRMIPDPAKVGDGRVNAKGIACLYLATKEETAALEVSV